MTLPKTPRKFLTDAMREITTPLLVLYMQRDMAGSCSLVLDQNLDRLITAARGAGGSSRNIVAAAQVLQQRLKLDAVTLEADWVFDANALLVRTVDRAAKQLNAVVDRVEKYPVEPYGLAYARVAKGIQTFFMPEKFLAHLLDRQKSEHLTHAGLALYVRKNFHVTISESTLDSQLKRYKAGLAELNGAKPPAGRTGQEGAREEGIRTHKVPRAKPGQNTIYILDVLNTNVTMLWGEWMVDHARAVQKRTPQAEEIAQSLGKSWGIRVAAADVRLRLKHGANFAKIEKVATAPVGNVDVVWRRSSDGDVQPHIVATPKLRAYLVGLHNEIAARNDDGELPVLEIAARATAELGLEGSDWKVTVRTRFVSDQLKHGMRLGMEGLQHLADEDFEGVVSAEKRKEAAPPGASWKNLVTGTSLAAVSYRGDQKDRDNLRKNLGLNPRSAEYVDAIKTLAGKDEAARAEILAPVSDRGTHERNIAAVLRARKTGGRADLSHLRPASLSLPPGTELK